MIQVEATSSTLLKNSLDYQSLLLLNFSFPQQNYSRGMFGALCALAV